MKAWRDKNRQHVKDYATKAAYKYRYGLSFEDVQELKKQQNFLCAICFNKRPLVVDHCHTTGRVRGMLCRSCNPALGVVEAASLKAFIDYLEPRVEKDTSEESNDSE